MSRVIVLHEAIKRLIHEVRGENVILDADLARLYRVQPKRLNEQVRRNIARFPDDFAFVLTDDEWLSLRSQNATLKAGRGQHRKYLPRAFTEHGAIMAANVLTSPAAIEASIELVRTFIAMRRIVLSHATLARKIDALERKTVEHDDKLKDVFAAIRALMAPVPDNPRVIGFKKKKEEDES